MELLLMTPDPRTICPCRVCQSDLAYIAPCEEPLMMEIIEVKVYDLVEQKVNHDTNA
jgi:hypothetical protein